VIVLGLGVMGLSACREIARRGKRVLGLEQYELGHQRGSSHGETRIIRKAYFEHPAYVPLLEHAYRGWAEIELELGVKLFERCGVLVSGFEGSAIVEGVRRAAAIHGIEIEELSGSSVARRFPGLSPGADMEAVFEPDAGFLHAESCVRGLAELAMREGAMLLDHHAAYGFSFERDRVTVSTKNEKFEARTLVVTAGAWSSRLLSDFAVQLEPRRKLQLWIKTDNRDHRLDRGCPVFAFHTPDSFLYGFPSIEPSVVKIAEHFGGEPVPDPGALDRTLHECDVTPVLERAAPRLPGLSREVVRHAACMYTMTEDEHFLIDRHPAHEHVVFAAGFSGHGFKFAPVIGSTLAELALDGSTSKPVSFLSLSRFVRG
jgi:monomeric sarcosine oxidase